MADLEKENAELDSILPAIQQLLILLGRLYGP